MNLHWKTLLNTKGFFNLGVGEKKVVEEPVSLSANCITNWAQSWETEIAEPLEQTTFCFSTFSRGTAM